MLITMNTSSKSVGFSPIISLSIYVSVTERLDLASFVEAAKGILHYLGVVVAGHIPKKGGHICVTYTTTGFGPGKNREMAGVDDLVVYMQTAVKYNTFYIHHQIPTPAISLFF